MKVVNLLVIPSVLTLPIVISVAPEAKADFITCNASSDKAYIAIAWYSKGHWLASGWTHVFPGECETILLGDMRNSSVYVYAVDKNWDPWQLEERKTAVFCLKQSAFEIVDADGSCASNMIPKPFYRIVSEGSYDYQLRLK